jgi:transposase-like protein
VTSAFPSMFGFWKAAGEVWPKTREQRCWVHKTANVLAKLPKSQHPKAKRALQEIWMAETKAAAELAFDASAQNRRRLTGPAVTKIWP